MAATTLDTLPAGAPFPSLPGYVVGTCGHAVAVGEWRPWSKVCDRCPNEFA